MANYCARCLAAWNAKDPDERKDVTPSRALTTVDGEPVCATHNDEVLAEVREARKAGKR